MRLVEPFDIDDGSLDGCSQAMAFVLGVEWAKVTAEMDKGSLGPFHVHDANVRRLTAAAMRRKFIIYARSEQDGWTYLVLDRLPNTTQIL